MRPFSVTAIDSASSEISNKVDIRFMHVLGVDVSWAFAAIPNAFNVATGSPFSIANNTISKASHGLQTGQVVRVTIDGGSLPAPLAAGVDYFAIYVSSGVFKLATSLAFAKAGTAIDITDTGTDNQAVTFTPQANVGSIVIDYTTDLEPDSLSEWRTFDTINLTSDTSPDISKTTYVNFHFIRATLSVTKGVLTTPCKVVFYGK
jgi:hypothetical protein